MKISGFTFVRNGVKFEYPFIESIKSIMPICDELIVVVGNSDDDTLQQIMNLKEEKIKIIQTIWDEKLREGGKILAQQTNIALSHITGDWGLYLQADEVIHEKYLDNILKAMRQYLHNYKVEGLLFKYIHFYGSYDYYADSRNWYRKEIRVVRNNIGVKSWKDAQGFRIDNRKMNVIEIDAYIYHYGWVKHPRAMMEKIKTFNKFWHDDEWIEKNIQMKEEFDYSIIEKLRKFEGTHPEVMKNRIENFNWKFVPPEKLKTNLKFKILDSIERSTGIRLGEYKNYKILK
ncbi:MAG: hypothetical protein IGBAC_1296 [Ignavibacteriae bacterium]|nr:MAG: hypothetical protein IGBAC_1296 [Ignavibacteriota bacterium]